MVRIMIMATMHDMTTTTIMEFRMLNQCTCNKNSSTLERVSSAENDSHVIHAVDLSCSHNTGAFRLVRTTSAAAHVLGAELTLPPGIFRYASQREDHAIWLSSQNTSYVYVILAPAQRYSSGNHLLLCHSALIDLYLIHTDCQAPSQSKASFIARTLCDLHGLGGIGVVRAHGAGDILQARPRVAVDGAGRHLEAYDHVPGSKNRASK